jgi:regulator of sirC expression with transglutaminase-like and TPR domain
MRAQGSRRTVRHVESAADTARRFAALLAGPTEQLELDRACALLAATFTGHDRTTEIVTALDDLAAQCEDPSLPAVLAVMRGRLRGNEEDYYDVRNSFIDSVLERGLGLPITLSVIAIELGRRVGTPIVGVGLPAHFMVRVADQDLFGDPFHDGAIYDRTGVVAAWERLVGPGQPFDSAHLAPVSSRSILIRMLNNLRAMYIRRSEPRAMHALALLRGSFPELAPEAPQHARWMSPWN